jgi:hypothetical protein
MTVTVRYSSSSDSDSDLDLDEDLIPKLALTVREMLPQRPNRWAFDLVDTRDGSRFESTYAFESPEQAACSGLARLERLKASATKRRLVIVSADDPELLASLKRLFAGTKRVEIVLDRRKGLASMEQRIANRRGASVSEAARDRGWWVAPTNCAQSA